MEKKLLISKETQPSKTMAYLGPNGTFTEMAAALAMDKLGGDILPIQAKNISEIFKMVADGTTELGIVPIENSTDGPVGDTLKNLTDFEGTFIGEVAIPISHSLYYQSAWLVQHVASKDTALRQCQKHISKYLPGRNLMNVDSTALAVQMAAADPTIAAIGSKIAAEALGLTEKFWRVDGVEDNPLNTTRFVVISKSREVHEDLENNKTTLLVHMRDEPGSLANCLHVFSENKINLTQIKSFLRDDQGVSFLISIDGGNHEASVKKAFNDLYTYANYRVLGSYVKDETESQEDQADINQIADQLKREAVNGNGIDHDESVLAFTLKDEVGSLEKVVSIFTQRKINLTRIDSIPTGRLNEYAFYLAFKNGIPNHQELLDEVKLACKEIVQIA
ncbi:MAG: hypothetical protein HYW86_04045 [Candidatus Roizmanbacteria bacterium]|nr:MAG: hypothetical protein HYW86_04045 [Candidatus Roizmanbacteria bacterium]